MNTTRDTGTQAARPGPEALSQERLSALLSEGQFGTLSLVRANGRPHLSTVLYRWDAKERVARISTTAGRYKARRLSEAPGAALHVPGPDVWSFAVAEGEAEVSSPTVRPGDAIGRELLSLTPGFTDPAEEEAFLRELVRERRVVIRLRAARLYGAALDLPSPS